MSEIDNYKDVLDVRDIIERFEELDSESDGLEDEDLAEREELSSLLRDLKGNGGDHQWQGDWYPVTLIRDSYFLYYAQELAEDIGAINPDLGWPYGCIDWDRAAYELQMDYTTVEYRREGYGSVTYWYR
jgi:hypothetical protein